MSRSVALFPARLADVMLSPWLTLGYNAHWLWHKTKKPDHDYYYNCENSMLRVKISRLADVDGSFTRIHVNVSSCRGRHGQCAML